MNPTPSNDAPHPHRSRFYKSFILSALIMLVLWVGLTAAWNTRKVQRRMKCAANLQKIGAAFRIYAAEHHETEPLLNWLVQQGDLDRADLVCPSAKDRPPNYVVIPRPRSGTNPADGILAYEPLSNHGDGANVLFDDGHCKFVPREQLQKLNIPAN